MRTRTCDWCDQTVWSGRRKWRLRASSTAGEQIFQPGKRFSDRLLSENLHQLLFLLPVAFTRACVNASFSHCHGCEGSCWTARRAWTSEPAVRWHHVHPQSHFLSLCESSRIIFIYFSPASAGICLFLRLPLFCSQSLSLSTTSNNLADLCRPPTDKYTSRSQRPRRLFSEIGQSTQSNG